ncbi:hypothetical protein E2K93_03190 [Thalassotalea sp. HSM 43]|uniref:TadE/TadG family type IV pilus assembly protein n=1 Tax=Thalassotalea sp. HSM 43 TaxID=2552945 RepID=UPI001081D651|nr:pilus assembly protein TadG-related protein [Thalassotalea sp. HSM 43]QBY03438.1 hypothetical protein E2K93_03190 [Thalassotalea sp. HSM 43]
MLGRSKSVDKQKGNILVLFTLGIVVIIGMAALALDGGHILLNKNRLQNYVDAAALHAAKTLDTGGNHADARSAAVEMLQANLAHGDAFEINDGVATLPSSDSVLSTSTITAQLTVEFSQRPDPFASVTDASARYVLVRVSNVGLNSYFAGMFGLDKQISASAVAGPSTAITFCSNDLVPMMICGDSTQTAETNFGLGAGQLQALKIDSDPNSPVGPGNFQLIELDGLSGANDLRYAMAGADSSEYTCFSPGVDNESVPTQPGNVVGPVADGLNTRFGSYHGTMKGDENAYPRDQNTCEGNLIGFDDDGEVVIPTVTDPDTGVVSNDYYTYQNYLDDHATESCTSSKTILDGNFLPDSTENDAIKPLRREIRVVIGDCGDSSINGANTVDFLGFGCFFLTQQVQHTGNEAYVVGEFNSVCSGTGTPSGIAEDNPGPYTIVLYHVPGSTTS